jgi:hypothetical protein
MYDNHSFVHTHSHSNSQKSHTLAHMRAYRVSIEDARVHEEQPVSLVLTGQWVRWRERPLQTPNGRIARPIADQLEAEVIK